MPAPLPIDPFVPDIVARLRREQTLILQAEPGAGKSTRVPPALTELGSVILLQPRRVAARSLARRIAEERRWTLGEEVGWQVRFDSRFSARTKLLVATEGIVTARLQSDPFLSDFAVVVLDEFHERSIHADLAIALVKQALAARDDLRLVVMSATLDVAPLQRFLSTKSLIEVPGRTFPVEISYASDSSIVSEAERAAKEGDGHVLCFLPGAREIDDAHRALSARALDVDVLRLHGSLPAEEQDRALAPSSRRKLILATNIAETSLTIDGVTQVIDSGEHKVLRYDAERALDRLVLERVPLDAATQRAGRAGRTAAGRAVRLWDPRQILRPHREAEILRIDLARTMLEVIAWGGDPRTFEWFERPPQSALDGALRLLQSLHLVDGERITERGRAANALPLHPRIASFLLATKRSDRALLAAALLDGGRVPPSSGGSESDLLSAVDRTVPDIPLKATMRQLRSAVWAPQGEDSDEALREAVLRAFPDRVARRRERGGETFVMASGTGALLSRQSAVRNAEFLVALELGTRDDGTPLIRTASAVEEPWLDIVTTVEHRIEGRRVRAFRRKHYGAIVLREDATAVNRDAAQELVAHELRKQVEGEAYLSLRRRLRFAGIDVDWDAITNDAAFGRSDLDVALYDFLPHDVRRRLETEAPTSVVVPSGRRHTLDYNDDGSVELCVKLQELFGLTETPKIGPRRVPLTILLLAPNGRPVQTTRDLASFWANTYPEVRKELRARYAKHPWPDDPLQAKATEKTKKRM